VLALDVDTSSRAGEDAPRRPRRPARALAAASGIADGLLEQRLPARDARQPLLEQAVGDAGRGGECARGAARAARSVLARACAGVDVEGEHG